MRQATSLYAALAGAALVLVSVIAGARPAAAQSPAALAGSVSSAEEGMMEGVLVSARKDGSTITTTVVSDNQGHYAFPAGRLEPGHYALSVRAVGYDLAGPKDAALEAGRTAAGDLKLVKTRKLADQLSNAEWIASAPGTDRQRALLTNCVGCHTVQRVFMSTHDSAEFMTLLPRMAGYSPGTTPLKPQRWIGPSPRGFGARQQEATDFFATINLSTGDSWEFPFKTLPRPKGRATHVIVTEYDLPRQVAMPHDVVLDRDGMPWYSDFGSLFIGELDPKTGKVTDYALPLLRPDEPTGTLRIDSDPNGNLWVAMMLQGGVARFDRQEKKFDVFPVPKDWLSDRTQESMIAPYSADVDGTVYTNNQARHEIYRVDLKTGAYTNLGAMRDAKGTLIDAYGMPADHDNNLYLLEFQGTHIGKFDAKTKTVKIYATPTPNSKPRRGRVDEENNLWFAEYGGNAIGKFDPKTEQITEWKLPTPHSDPYDVVRAKNGEVWAGSMVTDQIDRLDPTTGAITEYLLPRHTNIRRVFLDNSVNPPVLWVGNNHGASIVKIEPLD
jgi:virginiamycin B lyase